MEVDISILKAAGAVYGWQSVFGWQYLTEDAQICSAEMLAFTLVVLLLLTVVSFGGSIACHGLARPVCWYAS